MQMHPPESYPGGAHVCVKDDRDLYDVEKFENLFNKNLKKERNL